MPDEPEVVGLLALMLLIESRRAARTTGDGDLVLLADQDRSRWDRGLIAEGQAIVRRCLRRNQPGPYQIQAAINAVHSDAPTAAATDWGQILQLYDQLLALAPSPVVALNRAVAVAEVEGPEAALALVDGLDLHDYYLFHAIRADLLRRLGRDGEAALAYEAAIARTENAAERDFLERRLAGSHGASFTTVTKKLSICRMASMKRLEVHRLADVGVGVQRVAAQDVLLGLRRGQDDHRDDLEHRIGLDLGEHLQAVQARQVEVEQDQARAGRVGVVAGPAQELQRLLAVGHHVQHVAQLVVLERFPGHQDVPRVVLDQQHIHRLALAVFSHGHRHPRAVRAG